MEFNCEVCNASLKSVYQVKEGACSLNCKGMLVIKNKTKKCGADCLKTKTVNVSWSEIPSKPLYKSLKHLIYESKHGPLPSKPRTMLYETCGTTNCLNIEHLEKRNVYMSGGTSRKTEMLTIIELLKDMMDEIRELAKK